MENDKITEGLRKFAETFKNAQTERRAVILIPTHEGFMVHEVTKEIGLHAVAAQALKDKAEAERPNEDSGLTIPVVVGQSKQLFCPYCGHKKEFKIYTDVNSGTVCKNRLCRAK